MSDNYTAIKLFDDGAAAYMREDFKASIRLFSRALQYDRKFALVYSSRGAAYLRTNKLKKAISDLTQAIKLKPGDARSLHLRGLAYEKAGETARAYRDFDRAIEIDPDLSAAYRSRSAVLDKHVDERGELEDTEMADHLASMRVALLSRKAQSA